VFLAEERELSGLGFDVIIGAERRPNAGVWKHTNRSRGARRDGQPRLAPCGSKAGAERRLRKDRWCRSGVTGPGARGGRSRRAPTRSTLSSAGQRVLGVPVQRLSFPFDRCSCRRVPRQSRPVHSVKPVSSLPGESRRAFRAPSTVSGPGSGLDQSTRLIPGAGLMGFPL